MCNDSICDAPNAIEENEKISFRPVSNRVTNLLYLIDELRLNPFEMSDLSAGICGRMDWLQNPDTAPVDYVEDF